MLKNLYIGILFLQALLISDTSYDLEKLDEEEAGEADDQSEEGKYQIKKKKTVKLLRTSLVHNIFTIFFKMKCYINLVLNLFLR